MDLHGDMIQLNGNILNLHNTLPIHRHKKGLTQQQLADVLGVSQVTVQQWEQGRRLPDWTMMQAIAHALNAPMESLYTTAEMGHAQVNHERRGK